MLSAETASFLAPSSLCDSAASIMRIRRSGRRMPRWWRRRSAHSPRHSSWFSVRCKVLNQNAVEFVIGAQRLMFEELVFYTDEMLAQTRTRMRVFTDFAAKMGGGG